MTMSNHPENPDSSAKPPGAAGPSCAAATGSGIGKRVSSKRRLRDITLWAERWHDYVFLFSHLRAKGYRPACKFSLRVARWPAAISDQLDYVQDATGTTALLYAGDRDSSHMLVLASHWTDLARELIPEVTTTRDARGFTDNGEQAKLLASLFGQAPKKPKRPDGFRAYKHDEGKAA